MHLVELFSLSALVQHFFQTRLGKSLTLFSNWGFVEILRYINVVNESLGTFTHDSAIM